MQPPAALDLKKWPLDLKCLDGGAKTSLLCSRYSSTPGRPPGVLLFQLMRQLLHFALSAAWPWLWLEVLTGLLALGLAALALAG